MMKNQIHIEHEVLHMRLKVEKGHIKVIQGQIDNLPATISTASEIAAHTDKTNNHLWTFELPKSSKYF